MGQAGYSNNKYLKDESKSSNSMCPCVYDTGRVND
jgi:hypothetical protein